MRRLLCLSGIYPLMVCFVFLTQATAQEKNQKTDAANQSNPGQFFIVQEPITEESVRNLETAAQTIIRRELEAGQAPILIFEFRSRGSANEQPSKFGAILELCQVLSRKLTGSKLIVGYVPEPLTGFTALAPLACQEIIFQQSAFLGPIFPQAREDLTIQTVRRFSAELAKSLGRPTDLYEGLVDRSAELIEVTTNDNQRHYLLKSRLDEFAKSHQIVLQQPAWPVGASRRLSSEKARGVLSRLTVADKSEILDTYKLPQSALRSDPILVKQGKTLWIKIDGRLDSFKISYIRRQLALARVNSYETVILELNVRGNHEAESSTLANEILGLSDIRTIAFVTDKAEGMAVLPVLACDMILAKPEATIGDIYLTNGKDSDSDTKRKNQFEFNTLTKTAVGIATQKGHSAGLVKGLFDPESVILEALDTKSGGMVYVDQNLAQMEPARYQVRNTVKQANLDWSLDGTSAAAYGLAFLENSPESLQIRLGLMESNITRIGPSTIDRIISILNSRIVSGLILTFGLFLLILEFKLPGIGLPAIGASLCFMLFFWSHYLSGTADQLEILMFGIGLIFIALELFVFPGFGIFGLAGVILAVLSIVLASHTFIWPSEAGQYQEMSETLVQLLLAMVGGVTGIIWLSRNLKKMPVLKNLVLNSSEGIGFDSGAEMVIHGDSELNLSHLIGQTGLTKTPLRPTGKAIFGDSLVDATAETGMIEINQPILVTGTRGLRVIVRPSTSSGHSRNTLEEPFPFDEDLFKP